jgi:hypothetical protein
MSEGDVQRLFGRFRWHEYSPAGTLERHGFFLRQMNRYGGGPWRFAVSLMRLFVVVALIVIAVTLIVQLLVRLRS